MASPPDPEGRPNPYLAPTSEGDDGTRLARPRGASWRPFLILGLVSGVFFSLFWSIFMAFTLNLSFSRVLLGPGLACGLMFGPFMGVAMFFLMRPMAILIPVKGDQSFVNRLDRETVRLRYRLLDRSGETSTFGPRTLYRPAAFNVIVRVGPEVTTIVGPMVNVKALAKRLEAAKF